VAGGIIKEEEEETLNHAIPSGFGMTILQYIVTVQSGEIWMIF
jgi:hypothetical protein